MRRVIEPVLPTASILAVIVGILALAEPLVKFAVESAFSLVGF